MDKKQPDSSLQSAQARASRSSDVFFSQLKAYLKKPDYMTIALVGAGLILAVLLRWSLIDFKSADYFKYSKEWYNLIKSQGFRIFQTGFNVDNRPHMYLLYFIIRLFPNLPAVIATKIPSLIADLICAWFVSRIIGLRFQDSPLPIFGLFAVLFAPSVVLNGAMWGQSDSLFTAALMAFIFFYLTRHEPLAFLSYGLAVTLKPQAIFLLPFLLALFLKGKVAWTYFLLIPFVTAVVLSPAWLAGRSVTQLFNDYMYGVNQYEMLSMNAPTLYTIFPNQGTFYDILLPAGLLLATSVAFLFVLLVYKSHAKLTRGMTIELTLAILLLMPFFLPKMHDRYFFAADVVSIVYAFYFPARFFLALAVNSVSFLAYQPFLFGKEPVSMPVLSLIIFVVICIVMQHAIVSLYTCNSKHPQT